MIEKWPGYSKFEPPPGLDCNVIRRGRGPWQLEATWDGLGETIVVGPVPEHLRAREIDWARAVDWASVADDAGWEP